jgi:hypothetical protein
MNFPSPTLLLLAALLTGAALLAQRRPGRSLDVTAVLVGAGFTLLAVQAVRLLPLFGLAALPFIAGGLARVYPALAARSEERAPATAGPRAWGLAGLGAGLAIALSLTAPDAQLGRTPQAAGQRAYPVAAARVVAALPAPRRLFNEFEWGGYVLATVAPHRVFIDGRADMYRERVFDDYMAITHLAPGWRARLGRYGVDTVLIRSGCALDDALAHEPGWRVLHRDALAVVYGQ